MDTVVVVAQEPAPVEQARVDEPAPPAAVDVVEPVAVAAPAVIVDEPAAVVVEPADEQQQQQPEKRSSPVVAVQEPPAKKPRVRSERKKQPKRGGSGDDVALGLSRPAMHRIASQAGIARLDSNVVEVTRDAARVFVDRLLEGAIEVMEHQKRKTLKPADVEEAMSLIFPQNH